MDISATASNPRPSTRLDVTGALDVDVTLTLEDGVVLMTGAVTLAPSQYDGRLASYGASPDHWIGGAMLQVLKKLSAPGSASALDFRGACDAVEIAAVDAASAV